MHALQPCALVGGAALIDYRGCGLIGWRGGVEQTKRTFPGSTTDKCWEVCLSSQVTADHTHKVLSRAVHARACFLTVDAGLLTRFLPLCVPDWFKIWPTSL